MAGESIGIIDLDAVLKPDIKVKLDGTEWRLPGDPPTEILLNIVVLSEEMEKAVDADDSDRMLEIRRELTDAVEDLFSMRQEIPEGFGAGLVDAQISELVSKLFAHYYPGMGGDRPTPEPAAEEPPETARPRSSERSPKSSARARPRKRASASSKSSTT
jgi:hypothetical protein